MPTPIVINIPTKADLPRAAEEFLQAIEGRRVVALHGAMGAGKTTFVRAVCNALQISDTVNSPTFAIVNEYGGADGTTRVCHFDCYRLKNLQEAEDIGMEDYLYSGDLCLIEWPDLILPLLPGDAVQAEIAETEGGARRLSIRL